MQIPLFQCPLLEISANCWTLVVKKLLKSVTSVVTNDGMPEDATTSDFDA